MTRSGRFQRRGFTLVELAASVAVMSVLTVALGSAMILATQAIPKSGSPLEAMVKGALVADNIVGELHCALSLTNRSANAVEFTVPDRDEDGFPETIRYQWSNAKGEPLMRQYNGGTNTEVVRDVHEFDLFYTVQSLMETTTQVTTADSAEVLLDYFDGWGGITPDCAPKIAMTSEYFMAAIPDDVDQLRITRAKVMMRQVAGGSGSRGVAIHEAVGGGNPEPLPSPVGTPVTALNSLLPSTPCVASCMDCEAGEFRFEWVEFTFSDVVIDNPGKEYCIVTNGTTPTAGEVLYYFSRDAPTDSPVGLWSTDGGASWDPAANKRNQNDILFYVYGSYTSTSSQEVEVSRYFIVAVNIGLRIGEHAASRVGTTVQVLNAPEVSAP
jgi:prepilin-type N-terminal cleavage/methylation domain-containing protein